jgi:glycosyltransferase involved in cell wall biosynthesis
MESQKSGSGSKTRVGLLAEGFMQWAGGIDFLRMVADSLRMLENDNLELILFVPKVSRRVALRQALRPWHRWVRRRYGGWTATGLHRARIECRDEHSFADQVDRLRDTLGRDIAVEIFRGDRALAARARTRHVDCLIPSIRPLSNCVKVPWIGYIFDFQHRHLPDFFSMKERANRDHLFAKMARETDFVIVNSQDTREDCLRYVGDSRACFVALPFGASPRPEWLEDRGALRLKYDLPPRYFMVSNQFWVHKNHKIVFEALKSLLDSSDSRDLGVVCTGALFDSRAPSYYPSLLRYIEDNGLSKHVRILGLVPKRDQIEIMKSALGVVQPTLFEGGPGGGSVYDAISLGVPALVSDIPINRELEPESAPLKFFNPHDVNALAACMGASATASPTRPDASELLALGQTRARRVGTVLRATIDSAITKRPQQPL